MAQVDQLTGGVRATVPSEGLLLPWPEPAVTTPVGVVSFLKALSWYYACLHRVQAPGGNLRFGSPIRQCWRLVVMSLLGALFLELDSAGGTGGEVAVVCWCSLHGHDARAPSEGPEALL